ncbi:uncharacterized protein [Ambystoma mexicanum]|uniref:uncharacterized protein n=1 Tax=Ambystoma mexicanum TaxID=8296 RepID=UPI0037E95575
MTREVSPDMCASIEVGLDPPVGNEGDVAEMWALFQELIRKKGRNWLKKMLEDEHEVPTNQQLVHGQICSPVASGTPPPSEMHTKAPPKRKRAVCKRRCKVATVGPQEPVLLQVAGNPAGHSVEVQQAVLPVIGPLDAIGSVVIPPTVNHLGSGAVSGPHELPTGSNCENKTIIEALEEMLRLLRGVVQLPREGAISETARRAWERTSEPAAFVGVMGEQTSLKPGGVSSAPGDAGPVHQQGSTALGDMITQGQDERGVAASTMSVDVPTPLQPGALYGTKGPTVIKGCGLEVDGAPLVTIETLLSSRSTVESIPRQAKERIWEREYFNIFSLLSVFGAGPDVNVSKEEHMRRQKRIRVEENITNWDKAFSLLAGIWMEKYPEQAPALWQYRDNIIDEQRQYCSTGWIDYDKGFRLKMSMFPEMTWYQKDLEGWVLFMGGKDRARKGTQKTWYGKDESNHETHWWPVHQDPSATRGNNQENRSFGSGQACRQFNKGSCSWGARCRFSHHCSNCGGSHSQSVAECWGGLSW